MNTEKLEKLRKSLDNKFIPDNMKDKIRAEIKKLEADIKTDETITATEVKKEVKEIEKKVEKALEVAEEKEEKAEAKAPVKRTTRKPATSRTKTPKVEPKEKSTKKSIFSIAKEIRKDGESWEDAKERAKKMMTSKSTETKSKVRTETQKLLASIRRKKELKGLTSNIKRDINRTALPKGKRISENGKVYYEYRDDHSDRLAPSYKDKIYLAEGGGVGYSKKERVIDYYYNNDVFDDYESYGLSKKDLDNKVKVTKSIIKYHDLDDPKMVKEKFYNLGLDEYETGGSVDSKFDLAGFKRVGIFDTLEEAKTFADIERKQNSNFDAVVIKDDERTSQPFIVFSKLKKGKYIGNRVYEMGGGVDTVYDVDVNYKQINGYVGRFPMNQKTIDRLEEAFYFMYFDLYDTTNKKPMSYIEVSKILFDSMKEKGLYEQGGGVGKLSFDEWMKKNNIEVYKRTYYWVADDGKGDYLYSGKKTEVMQSLKEDYKKDKYADGGAIIGIPETPLARGLDIDYTTLVGETDAMSSGEMFAKGGGVRMVGNREYSIGRNWTNDHRHVNKSEKHETNYNRKRSFDDGGDIGNNLSVVKVKFKDPKYNYITNMSRSITKEDAEKYFIGKSFNVGEYPKENMQKVVDIEFYPAGTYKKKSETKSYADKGVYVETLDEEIDLTDDGIVKATKTQQGGNKSFGERREMHGASAEALAFAEGGSIENQYEGKTAKEVWNMWTLEQRQHFLLDHFHNFIVSEFKSKSLIEISKLEYGNLPTRVRLELDYHVNKGQYAMGGSLGNHGLKQGDQIIKTMSGGVQKVKTKSGDIVYVNLANGYRGVTPPLPFVKGGGVEKRSLKSVIHLVDWKGEGIKKWYLRSYPKDEMGEELNDTVTFKDLWDALNEKKDVYEIIGVGDSLIRERLFEYLALLYNVDYDVVYKKWLESDDYAKGGGVRMVGNREYSIGRNWTNDHRHVNKSEKHETNYNRKRSYDDGGMIYKDLFEDYENQPAELSEIVSAYMEKFEEGDYDYEDSKKFLAEVESVGYTFDYGLDNEPYGLRPIGVELSQIEGYEEEYKKGGEMPTFKSKKHKND